MITPTKMSTDEYIVRQRSLAVSSIAKIKQLLHEAGRSDVQSSTDLNNTNSETSTTISSISPKFNAQGSNGFAITAAMNGVTTYLKESDKVVVIGGSSYIVTKTFNAVVSQNFTILIYNDLGKMLILEITQNEISLSDDKQQTSQNFKSKIFPYTIDVQQYLQLAGIQV
jgi:hypothetical protein